MEQLRKDIFFIGGGTCCGKSTLTERLVSETGYQYYKLDDDLFDFLDRLAEAGHKTAQFQKNCSPDELWLRDPAVQNTEELAFYGDMLPLALEEIAKLPADRPVVAEGAGYLPGLMHALRVPADRYVCIVPSREFRLREYRKRPWIGQVLEGCSDKEKAFANWMERDALFSESVLRDAEKLGYKTFTVDGSKPASETLSFVKTVFGLTE